VIRSHDGNRARGRARGALLAVALGLALLALAGCSKEVTTPVVGGATVTDPTVTPQSRLLVGDHSLTLTWTVSDTTRVSEYRVFRSKQATSGYAMLATARSRTYTDATVQPNTVYYYQVVSVLKDGKQSQASTSVSGTSNLFALSINGGLARTRSLALSIQLSVPSGTSYMQLAESSDFPGTAWETFTTTRTYNILPGDGPRTIWARFRDRDGNESAPVYHTIILDTQAVIDSVQCSPAGGVLAPGTVAHFRVRTRGAETEGAATVDVGQRLIGIVLTDQGVNGDTHAGDGIYEIDYTLPRGFDVLRVPVVGHFTDAAGNKAPDLPADSLFTLHTPPNRVTLLSVTPSPDETSSSLDLAWSPNNEAGFSSYQVYRADAAGTAPPASPSAYARLTTITGRSTLSYTDATAREGQKYAYRVDVVDSLGYSAQGTPVLGTSRSQSAVTLNAPVGGSGADSLNVLLTWTQSLDPIFSSYQVLRAEAADTLTAPAEAAFLSVSSVTTKTTLSYTDVAPRENTAFWYRVDELGTSGIRHPSRPRPYLTLNSAPPAVTLSVPFEAVDGQVSLSWTRSNARDFASYRVYRAQGAGADTTLGTLVLRTSDPGTLTAVDNSGLQGNKTYWYRVWVTDVRGLSTGSAEQSYTTHNQPPPAVTITSAGASGPGVRVTWTQSPITDFTSYTLFRSRDASVSNGAVLVGTVTDQYSPSFTEVFGHVAGPDSLKPNTDYYYRVYVNNKGGMSTGSVPMVAHTPAWSQAPSRLQAVKPRQPVTRPRH
jgi:fibronectin type 3 domain-containing protein